MAADEGGRVSLLEQFMPRFDTRSHHAIDVRAPAQAVFTAVEAVAVREVRFLRELEFIRALPRFAATGRLDVPTVDAPVRGEEVRLLQTLHPAGAEYFFGARDESDSWQSLCSPDPEALCGERRLSYVAATRAKDRLILTHVRTRAGRDAAGPSRFPYEAGLMNPSARRAA